MAKKQTTPSVTVDAGQNVQGMLNLKTILEDVGIQVTDQQLESLSAKIVIKKQPRKSTKYESGTVVLAETDKIAPQMRVALLNFKDGLTLNEWADELAKDTRFVTKQSPLNILAYYRKDMIEKGYIQPKN